LPASNGAILVHCPSLSSYRLIPSSLLRAESQSPMNQRSAQLGILKSIGPSDVLPDPAGVFVSAKGDKSLAHQAELRSISRQGKLASVQHAAP
jgi:hypothetical protein